MHSLASNFQSKDHIRMNFYELLLLEIQKLISAPLSPSLFFFLSLVFCCIYLLSITAVQFLSARGEIETSVLGER